MKNSMLQSRQMYGFSPMRTWMKIASIIYGIKSEIIKFSNRGECMCVYSGSEMNGKILYKL
jgi:hypothetical protein